MSRGAGFRGRGPLFALLAVALLAAVGLLLTANLERVPQRVWVGWQGEARSNPYLAAKRFLDRSGWPTDCFHGLPLGTLTAPDRGLLILPQRTLRLSPGQVAALAGFVERGGLLLAAGAWDEVEGTREGQDPLFAAFGARKLASDWSERVRGLTPKELQAWHAAHRTVRVQLAGTAFEVRLDPGSRLEDRSGRALSALGDDLGPKVLVAARGKGLAVLFTDLDWLQNGSLGAHDHAAFLEAIAGLAGPPFGRAALVIREEAPSLAGWLREKAPAALALAAVLVALALWSAMPRFGPLRVDAPEARRSLLEHLAACGRFQWRLEDGRSLLKAARQAALDRIGRSHPAWTALAPDALCQRIAAETGLSEAKVFRALRYDRHPDPHGFTEAIQTLDQIRKLS